MEAGSRCRAFAAVSSNEPARTACIPRRVTERVPVRILGDDGVRIVDEIKARLTAGYDTDPVLALVQA